MRGLVVLVVLAIASPARADDAWSAYDEAFVTLAGGNRDRARSQLEAIETTWPDHPAAVRARARLDELGPRPAPPAHSNQARAELVLGMTVTGVFAGIEACVDVCDEVRSDAAAVMLGGGGALAATMLASRGGIEPGEAQLYNSATTWGRWNALGINDGFSGTSREAWTSIGAQAAGLAIGLGLWQLWRPTAGDVALTNSGLLWGTVLTMFGYLAADREPTMKAAVIAGDVGLLAAAALSAEVKMSRGRTLLIDTGGVIGTLVGGLFAVGQDGSDRTAGAALMIGTALGLGLATLLTNDWDASPDRVSGNAR